MCAPAMMRAAMLALLLGPGLAIANGTAPVVPDPPSGLGAAPATPPGNVSPAPVWLHRVPAAWPQAVYWVPAPGMMWPMAPAYPAPIPMPYPSAGWRPFVMMWVPVTAQAPASVTAGVGYGPVADAPVVELPLPASTPESASAPVPTPAPAGAMRSPAITEPGKPDEGPAAAVSVLELPASAETGGLSLAADAQASAMPAVDYGPVAPTPVVDLLALEQQAAVPRPRNMTRVAPKPLQKSVRQSPVTAAPASALQPAAKPVKKRLCWNKGVVAPCR